MCTWAPRTKTVFLRYTINHACSTEAEEMRSIPKKCCRNEAQRKNAVDLYVCVSNYPPTNDDGWWIVWCATPDFPFVGKLGPATNCAPQLNR